MFLTFSQIFSASKQIYYQIQQNPNSSKPKFSIPNKKKFIKLEINPKSENNKIRTTHTTTTTTRKSEIKESKQIGDKIDPKQADRQFSGKISGLTNGATISGFATISDEWVWQFLALLDEWARSWVFWVHRSSWMWINLAFVGAGVLVWSLFLAVSLSLLFSWGGSDLKWKWERKLFSALSLILRSNWKHFQFDQIFSNSKTSTFPEKHF